MTDFNMDMDIRVGMRFNVHGAEMEACYVDEETVRYAACIGGTQSTMARTRLQEKLAAGSWRITFIPPVADGASRSAAMLSDSDVAAANRRRKYLNHLKDKLGLRWPNSKLREELKEIARDLGEVSPPDPATVRRWLKISLVIGSNQPALAMNDYKKGTYSRFTPDAELVMEEALRTIYMSPERLSIEEVRSQVIAKYAGSDELEKLFPRGVPSARTLSRRAEALDGFETVAARHGLKKAQRMFRASGRGEWTTRILQMVQGDGQLMDVLLLPQDGEGKPLEALLPKDLGRFRPYATVLVDCETRAVISCTITAAPFSTCTVLQALKVAVSADGDKPRGIPEVLSIDNGGDYISDGLKRAANRFGIEVIYSQPYRPDNKAVVERFIQELNRFVHTLPGTVFSSPEQRGDYPSEKLACLTLTDLRRLVDEFVEIYNRTVHGTTKRAPIEAWRDSAAQHPPRQVDRTEADAVARVPHRRVVTKGRVTFEDLEYFSHGLSSYEQSKRLKNQKPWVDVLVDEFDLGTVLVQPIDSTQMFLAESTKPAYTTGLTMFEHEQIKEQHRAAGLRDLHKIGEKELAQRKAKLREEIRELQKTSKKAARKAARMEEANATKPAPRESAVPEKLVQLESLPETVAPAESIEAMPPPYRIVLTPMMALPTPSPPAPQEPPVASTPLEPTPPGVTSSMTALLAQPSQISTVQPPRAPSDKELAEAAPLSAIPLSMPVYTPKQRSY